MRFAAVVLGLVCVCMASAWIAAHVPSRATPEPPHAQQPSPPRDTGRIRGRLRVGDAALPYGVVELSAHGAPTSIPADREGYFATDPLPAGVWDLHVRLPPPDEVLRVQPARINVSAGRTELIEVDAVITR